MQENTIENELRSSIWLKQRFKYLHERYFSDVEIKNNIIIKFGRPCTTRLGSIKKGKRKENFNSIITINGHFRDPEIPCYVIDAVIAHEFMHYAHGFASPHDQKYKHPHQCGVVDKELIARGFFDILKAEKNWVKQNWQKYLMNKHPYKQKSSKKIIFKWW